MACAKAVKPTRSQNSTDTTFRSSLAAADADVSGAPQPSQNLASGRFSWPQREQIVTTRCRRSAPIDAASHPPRSHAPTALFTPQASCRLAGERSRAVSEKRRLYARAVERKLATV